MCSAPVIEGSNNFYAHASQRLPSDHRHDRAHRAVDQSGTGSQRHLARPEGVLKVERYPENSAFVSYIAKDATGHCVVGP
eukprot:scaffold31041_cov69-Phaeocystis_antarctica.AAC.4